jgi:hypothetical protein
MATTIQQPDHALRCGYRTVSIIGLKGEPTMEAKTLSIPGPRLWMWPANDSIVCEAHTSPSDWPYERLSQRESDEFRGFIRAEYGDVDACESCRYGIGK